MASELAQAIVEASVMMQKQEQQKEVRAYLTGNGRGHFWVLSVDPVEYVYSEDNGHFFDNYFAAINTAKQCGLRPMLGDDVKELIRQANAAHEANGCTGDCPVYAVFQ